MRRALPFLAVLGLLCTTCSKDETASTSGERLVQSRPDEEVGEAANDTPADAALRTKSTDASEVDLNVFGALDVAPVRVSTPDAWRRCNEASECTVVVPSCGDGSVVVNKRSRLRAEEAWTKACKGAGGLTGALPPKFKIECRKGLCTGPTKVGLGELLKPEE